MAWNNRGSDASTIVDGTPAKAEMYDSTGSPPIVDVANFLRHDVTDSSAHQSAVTSDVRKITGNGVIIRRAHSMAEIQ